MTLTRCRCCNITQLLLVDLPLFMMTIRHNLPSASWQRPILWKASHRGPSHFNKSTATSTVQTRHPFSRKMSRLLRERSPSALLFPLPCLLYHLHKTLILGSGTTMNLVGRVLFLRKRFSILDRCQIILLSTRPLSNTGGTLISNTWASDLADWYFFHRIWRPESIISHARALQASFRFQLPVTWITPYTAVGCLYSSL